MLEDLVNTGTLEMSAAPVQALAENPGWGDFLVNRILVAAAVLLVLFTLKDIIKLLPSILACLDRARANASLEHSLSLARTRNLIALEMILPFCLIADRFSLYEPSFSRIIPDEAGIAVTAGAFIAYLLLRKMLFLLFRPLKMSSEAAGTVHHTSYNYFIAMTVLMMLTTGILTAFHCPDNVARAILLCLTAASFLFSLVRTGQILAYSYGTLSTFLYLCALELMPAGALVASAIVL